LILTKYYERNVKDDEDSSCSTDGGEVKFIKGFGGKIGKKNRPSAKRKNSVQIHLKGFGKDCVGVDSAG
jgi:hypothetical protein